MTIFWAVPNGNLRLHQRLNCLAGWVRSNCLSEDPGYRVQGCADDHDLQHRLWAEALAQNMPGDPGPLPILLDRLPESRRSASGDWQGTRLEAFAFIGNLT
jgi:hypothetical protein